jgi:histidinol-phosphate aminotransferase
VSALELMRPDLRDFRGYASARRVAAAVAAIALDANEAAGERAAPWQRYPEPQPAALRASLAALYEVEPPSILLTRGSDEAIDLLTRAFCRAGVDAILVSPPTFGFYAVSAALQGAGVVEVALRDPGFAWRAADVEAAVAREPAVRLVHVCTPNNPTGGLAPRDEVVALARVLRGRALVVVDEAYVEFSGQASLARRAAAGELVVLRTLSKAHALAGARIGALVAEPSLVAMLERLLAPYPLAAPAVAAALSALEPATLAATRARVAQTIGERTRLGRRLAGLRGVRAVLPSDANFLLVRFRDRARAFGRLAQAGISVRDVSRAPGLGDALRITVGTPSDNDAVVAALGSA